MNTRSAAKRRAKLHQRRTILALVLAGGLIAAGSWAWRSAHPPRLTVTGSDLDRNAAMIQNTFAVQQAIEAYAQAHGGQVPAEARAVDREVVQGAYLMSKQLPDSPWGGKQPDMVQATEQLRRSLAQSTDIGPAEVSATVRHVTDLGALCYEAIGPQAYRLYGIGRSKEGKAAVIIQLGAPPSIR